MSEHDGPPENKPDAASESLSRTPMWTLAELSAKLHTTPRVIHGWRRRGTAPKAYKVGRHLLFEESDIAAWLAERESERAGDDADGGDSGSGW